MPLAQAGDDNAWQSLSQYYVQATSEQFRSPTCLWEGHHGQLLLQVHQSHHINFGATGKARIPQNLSEFDLTD